jgi:hypothetical protein
MGTFHGRIFLTPGVTIQRSPKGTSLIVRSSRGRCARHLHDTRATWRTSYANFARNICVTYAPDSRRMRVTSAIARTCRTMSAQQGMFLCNWANLRLETIKGYTSTPRKVRLSSGNVSSDSLFCGRLMPFKQSLDNQLSEEGVPPRHP